MNLLSHAVFSFKSCPVKISFLSYTYHLIFLNMNLIAFFAVLLYQCIALYTVAYSWPLKNSWVLCLLNQVYSSFLSFPYTLYFILYVKNLIWVWLNVYSLCKQTCSNILCVPCKWTLDLIYVFLLIYCTTLKLCLFWGFPFLGPTGVTTLLLLSPHIENDIV